MLDDLDDLFAAGANPENIYICYSNLHAFQASLLSLDMPGVCLYSSAVSADFLRQEFNGAIKSISGAAGTLKDALSLAFGSLKHDAHVNIFTGCKVGYASLALLNKCPHHQLYLLDDGLSMYGLSQQRPQPPGAVKHFLKFSLAMLLQRFGCTYFSGDTIGSLDRKATRLLLWPQLFRARDRGIDVPFADMLGDVGKARLAGYGAMAITTQKSIYVASYEKSLEIAAGNILAHAYDEVVLHPRVAPRTNTMPLEVSLPGYTQITMGMSSIILVLAFTGYTGHITLDADDHTRWVMQQLTSMINLPFSFDFLDDTP